MIVPLSADILCKIKIVELSGDFGHIYIYSSITNKSTGAFIAFPYGILDSLAELLRRALRSKERERERERRDNDNGVPGFTHFFSTPVS
mmetsp:Transcript_5562/g.16149  ORF Transcript_5562/g.16149 Transcript_5562/m.16149 type:complete len:89 (+) Transcript_5562:171-437(+)